MAPPRYRISPKGSRRAARTAFRRCAAAAESPAQRPHPSIRAQSRSGRDGANRPGSPGAGHTHRTPCGLREGAEGPGSLAPVSPRGGAVGAGDGQHGVDFWRSRDQPETGGQTGQGGKGNEIGTSKSWGESSPEQGGVVTAPANAGEGDAGHLQVHQLFPTMFLREKTSYYSPFGPAGHQGSKATSHTQNKSQQGFKSLEKQ